MTKHRILIVQAVVALLIGGSFHDIITGEEHWPLSSYPMYARLAREFSYSSLELYGVTEEIPQHEIRLTAPEYIQPFDKSRLTVAFARLQSNPQREGLVSEALRDCLRRYENLRRTGRHQGPRLQGLRLYQVQWSLEPLAGNADRLSSRRLLAEVEWPEGEF